MCISLMGCYAEFELGPLVPRRDPCTGKIETQQIYFMPNCRYPAVPEPPEGSIQKTPSLIPGQ